MIIAPRLSGNQSKISNDRDANGIFKQFLRRLRKTTRQRLITINRRLVTY